MKSFFFMLIGFAMSSSAHSLEFHKLCEKGLFTTLRENLESACFQQKLKNSSPENHHTNQSLSYRIQPGNIPKLKNNYLSLDYLDREMSNFCLKAQTQTSANKHHCEVEYRALQWQLKELSANIGKLIRDLDGPAENTCLKENKKLQAQLHSQEVGATHLRKQFDAHYKKLCPKQFPKRLYTPTIKGGGIPAVRE